MRKLTPKLLKNHLEDSIIELSENKDKYLISPKTAFSRTQKISFKDAILFPILAESGNTYSEMVDYFNCADDMPTQAAMSYRRAQIKSEAYEDLFKSFTIKLPQVKKYRGMLAIGVDGTRLNTPYNPHDTESFVNHIPGRRGYNQYHLNACEDLLNGIYVDAIIQPSSSINEKRAFCTMVDRSFKDTSALFILDRGYSSFNVMAHITRNNQKFVIRITSSMALNLFNSLDKYDKADIFDIEDTINVGRSRSKKLTSLHNYHRVRGDESYDYLPISSKEVDSFNVRLVKLILDSGNVEYLLTNLPKKDFTVEDLKEIYHLRWKIETSFRFLKYSTDIVRIHSVKRECIYQEIFAKLTMFNFCAVIGNMVPEKRTKTYVYICERTNLIKQCFLYLKNRVKDIIEAVEKRRVPVRATRQFERLLRKQHAVPLSYR